MFGVQGLESGDPTIPSIEPANTDDPTDIPGSSANEGQDNHKDDLSTDNKIDTAPESEEISLLLIYGTMFNEFHQI